MTSKRIRDVLRTGKRQDTPYLTFSWDPASREPGQAACVVGKKVHASAVVRHRYQRLLREAVREIQAGPVGYDMVIMAKPDILQLKKMAEIKTHLEPYLSQIAV